jgi:hypothetical protein
MNERWVADLLASVSLGYPIGAVTLLRADAQRFDIPTRPVDGVLGAGVAPRWLLVDGQHRMSALHLAFWPSDAQARRLYLDLEIAQDPQADRADALVWATANDARDSGHLLDLPYVFAEGPSSKVAALSRSNSRALRVAGAQAVATFQSYRIPIIALNSPWTGWTIRMRAGQRGRELVTKYRVNQENM